MPGDLLNVKLGDIVPADCKLLGGKALEVDQAALTGESLPVTRGPGDTVFMGSVIRRGEIEAVVCFTGGRTFFGRAAEMVNRAAGEQQGRFAKVMFQNTIVLFTLSVLFALSVLTLHVLALPVLALPVLALPVLKPLTDFAGCWPAIFARMASSQLQLELRSLPPHPSSASSRQARHAGR